MAFRTQTYEVTALHESLGLELATADRARNEKTVVDDLARRGFTHLWTIRTRVYRLGNFQVRTRADLGPLAERSRAASTPDTRGTPR